MTAVTTTTMNKQNKDLTTNPYHTSQHNTQVTLFEIVDVDVEVDVDVDVDVYVDI